MSSKCQNVDDIIRKLVIEKIGRIDKNLEEGHDRPLYIRESIEHQKGVLNDILDGDFNNFIETFKKYNIPTEVIVDLLLEIDDYGHSKYY